MSRQNHLSTRERLRDRFTMYWKLELLNIALFPSVFVTLMFVTNQPFGWLSFICYLPMAGLLIVGGLYWRGKLKSLDGQTTCVEQSLRLAKRLRIPLTIGTAAAVVLCLLDVVVVRLSTSLGDRLAAIFGSTMAVLELINYYAFQVQHFDHRPDFLRLISGRGFRKSHLSQDMKRLRDSGYVGDQRKTAGPDA